MVNRTPRPENMQDMQALKTGARGMHDLEAEPMRIDCDVMDAIPPKGTGVDVLLLRDCVLGFLGLPYWRQACLLTGSAIVLSD